MNSVNAEADFLKFKTDFKTAINVGISGSGFEQMYESVNHVLVNEASFYQSNRLSIIINVSDEPEQSTKKSASQWARTFHDS